MSEADFPAAVRWFGRASRLAPADLVISHLLASALSRTDPPLALRLLKNLVDAGPCYRDAHVSLAALHSRCGNAPEAAQALHRLLCNFAVPHAEAFHVLATRIASEARCAGWVGVTGEGFAAGNAACVSFSLDGAPIFSVAPLAGSRRLPRAWKTARFLHANSALGDVLGGSVDLATLRRVEGVVAFDPASGLRGWALAPSDPDTPMVIDIFIRTLAKPFASIAADRPVAMVQHNGAQHASGFHMALTALPDVGSLRVRARQGAELAGSPVAIRTNAPAARRGVPGKPASKQHSPVASAAFSPAPARTTPSRAPLDILIVAGGDAHAIPLPVEIASLPAGTGILAIRSDPHGRMALHDLQQGPEAIEICPLGQEPVPCLAAAINVGLRRAGARDVLLLRGHTRLPAESLRRLVDALYSAPGIGTASAMTNTAGLTGLGAPGQSAPLPLRPFLASAAALQSANSGLRVEMPVCAGACILIRHDCRLETGLFCETAFAHGEGAAEDFACRAASLGWRHVAACDAIAAAYGSPLSQALQDSLLRQSADMLERLHPGYAARLADVLARDPLRPARAAYDAQRWAEGRRNGAIILVTHDLGGGVERHVRQRAAEIRALGLRAIVLRPSRVYAVSDGADTTHPNLVFASVDDLAAFLAADRPGAVELHHIAEHDTHIGRLAGKLHVPFDFFLHDYAAFCPRVTFCVAGTYCGAQQDSRVCDGCIADHGAQIPFAGTVAAWREKTALMLGAARKVVVATTGGARLLRRFAGTLKPKTAPWENDAAWPPAEAARPRNGHVKVAMVGGIGPEKGYHVLLACAHDAMLRELPLHFSVVGHTIDDSRLLDTGRVFITGPFAEGEALRLLREESPTCGFLPSIWPETWCYALSALWEAGLHVMAFDLGAQAERIRARGVGTLMPPGSPPGALNDRLLALSGLRESDAGS